MPYVNGRRVSPPPSPMDLGSRETREELRRALAECEASQNAGEAAPPPSTKTLTTTDEAVRDLKRSISERDRSSASAYLRCQSEPQMEIEPLHPDVGTFRDIAQPGGFRREHILRSSIEMPSDHPAQRSLMDSLLNPLILDSLPTSPRGGSSDMATILLFIKSTVGGTMIVIPGGFKDAGLAAAPALLVFLGAVEIYCMVLLIRCSDKLRGASYGEIARGTLGLAGRIAVDVSLFLSQVGFVCTEMLYVAKNGRSALKGMGLTNAPTVNAILLLQLLITVPMSLIRKLEYFKTTNLLANVIVLLSLTSLLFIAFGKLDTDGVADGVRPVGGKWPLFAGTAVFAFECINFILPMYEAHERKETFIPIMISSLGGVCGLFVLFGGVNYLCYGKGTAAVLTKNLDPDTHAAKVVPFVFSIASLFTVPLLMFPAAMLCEGYMFGSSKSSMDVMTKAKKNLFRTVLVVFCAVVAAVGAESIEAFVSLIGSFCCVPLAFIYPCICHLRLCKPGPLAAATDYIIAMLGVVIFVSTSKDALEDILARLSATDAEPYYMYSYYYT